MSQLTLFLSIVLGATYLGAGALKLLTPRDKLLRNPRMAWANDYPDRSVKGIGLAEVLGAVGLFAPWYSGVAAFLTPVAAVLLAVLQALAVRVHLRHGETKVVAGNVALLVLALAVAVLRFTELAQGSAAS
jgi:DoxX-like family